MCFFVPVEKRSVIPLQIEMAIMAKDEQMKQIEQKKDDDIEAARQVQSCVIISMPLLHVKQTCFRSSRPAPTTRRSRELL